MHQIRSFLFGVAAVAAMAYPNNVGSADLALGSFSRNPIAPYLTVKGASNAIEFYKRAFGAAEKSRVPSADRQLIQHAELSLNKGVVMLSDEIPGEIASGAAPQPGQNTAVSISLQFDTPTELDTMFAKAINAGATSIVAPTNKFWGARFALMRDPFGHRWMLNSPASK